MVKVTPLDISEYLDSDEVIAEYLRAAAEDPNPDVFLAAMGDVAKARGMADLVGKACTRRYLPAVILPMPHFAK